MIAEVLKGIPKRRFSGNARGKRATQLCVPEANGMQLFSGKPIREEGADSPFFWGNFRKNQPLFIHPVAALVRGTPNSIQWVVRKGK